MIWSQLKYFKKEERNHRDLPAWGDPDKMNGVILLIMDRVRHASGWPVIVHCGYEKAGHVKASQHYKGNAVDFHFKTDTPFRIQAEAVIDILRELQVSEFVGLGIYPSWINKGFHLDCRGHRARWGRIEGEYVSFQEALAHS
jgi:uncharacterized protein YcbK (DUF882 family)